jgi:broad specificity phosphatase PhoE
VTPPAGLVVLLRHGETEWSLSGQHTGRTDVPLTERGRDRARALGPLLTALRGTQDPPALVLSSPLSRARETAELAGLHPEIDERLHEWDYGDCEGRTTEEIREDTAGWTVWTHACPGGETAEQVGERADAVLERARQARAQGDVVLVGHGHFSRVLAARWLDQPATAGVHYAMDAGSLTVLGDERDVPRLDHVNLVDLRNR